MKSGSRLASGLLVFVAGLLTGCDAILDCVDNDGPVFRTSALPTATLNQTYSETIEVSINNEPFDDRFDYEFSIIRGILPNGISTTEFANSLLFRGTPIELGTFELEINVFADDGLDSIDSNLCYRNRSRNFTLLVEQDNS